jgi:hypothetical protein
MIMTMFMRVSAATVFVSWNSLMKAEDLEKILEWKLPKLELCRISTTLDSLWKSTNALNYPTYIAHDLRSLCEAPLFIRLCSVECRAEQKRENTWSDMFTCTIYIYSASQKNI